MIFDSDTPRVRLIYRVALVAILALVLLRALVMARQIAPDLAVTDNDSLMRLVMVRDWLAGQGWFDTRQFRLMPPEGVLMHWSRYIDAALGGLVLAFSVLVPRAMAEVWMMTVWPVLLSVLLVLAFGLGTRRIFGPVAAIFAMLTAVVWPFTAQFYFLPGEIDHHNVQILMIVVMTFAVLWPERPVGAGMIAGISAGFALAVGLETLPYILLLGLLLFLRAGLRIGPAADPRLAAFSVTLLVASVLFWLGQTPPSLWRAPVCDQLGLPVLSLAAIAALASLVPMWLLCNRPVARLALGSGLVVLGCGLAWPLLGPCLAGPYGSLPPAVQEIISGNIVEARPAIDFAVGNPMLFVKMALPVAIALALGLGLWWRMDRADPVARMRADVVGQLLILATVGLLASLSQVRLLLMSAGALPVLVGVVMAALLQSYLRGRDAGQALAMFLAGSAMIAPVLAEPAVRQYLLPATAQGTVRLDHGCRATAAMARLNALEPAVFLTSLNLGPVILSATHHSTVAGPYHRSPDAFANGRIPLSLPQAELRSYLASTAATHLMLCRSSDYGDSFAAALTKGARADWLRPISIDAGDILVFEIAPE